MTIDLVAVKRRKGTGVIPLGVKGDKCDPIEARLSDEGFEIHPRGPLARHPIPCRLSEKRGTKKKKTQKQTKPKKKNKNKRKKKKKKNRTSGKNVTPLPAPNLGVM